MQPTLTSRTAPVREELFSPVEAVALAESHASGPDRNEVGAVLVAAGSGSARDHALVSLLALIGLRVSDAISADIEALGLERGHRTLTVLRKGGKVVTVPLAPPRRERSTSPAENGSTVPILTTGSGCRLDRHAAARILRRIARRAGIAKRVGPHTLRHAFITATLDADVPLRDVQEAVSHADRHTTMAYDRARVFLDRHATYIVATFIAGAARSTLQNGHSVRTSRLAPRCWIRSAWRLDLRRRGGLMTITRMIPLLVYENIEDAHDFLVRAFGFDPGGVERDPEGNVVHGEVRSNDGVIWLHRVTAEHQLASPGSGAASGGLVIHVEDVDAHFARAREAGALIASEPRDQPYGQREYGARDAEGHRWWFATPFGQG